MGRKGKRQKNDKLKRLVKTKVKHCRGVLNERNGKRDTQVLRE